MRKIIANIWMILTVNCEDSAMLTSQSFDRDLHFAERVAIWIHCLICSKSRRLHKQMHTLNDKLSGFVPEEDDDSQYKLPLDVKGRIKQTLQKAESSGG